MAIGVIRYSINYDGKFWTVISFSFIKIIIIIGKNAFQWNRVKKF